MPACPHHHHTKAHQGGFTLIELMITLALIGILAAVIMSIYTPFVASGYNDQAKGDIMSVVTSQERWFADNNTYAPDVATLHFTPHANVTIPPFAVNGTSFNACAKHLWGDKIYGYDSDTRQYYQQDSARNVALAACPAATTGDDFGGWQPMK
ncbi:type IV pilin protein [Dissulfurimicrobium hydrothermale]|uniref:type IV pilin protein n=1 Tax=Dissulfurimicrobium hydrothermale TaxID=1750598 RepID=UPI002ED3B869